MAKRGQGGGKRGQRTRGKALSAADAQAEAQRAAADKIENTTVKLPSENDVLSLTKRLRGLKKQASEITGSIGEAVASAVEKKNFDRKALSIARGLDSMSDAKLAMTLPHLMHYIKSLGLMERATAQGQMFEDSQDDDAAPDNKPRVVAGRDVDQTAGEAAAVG